MNPIFETRSPRNGGNRARAMGAIIDRLSALAVDAAELAAPSATDGGTQ